MTNPKPPKDLSKEAKALWRQIFSEVELDSAALLLLNLMCQSWDRMAEARAAIAKEGAVIAGRFAGTKVANPWCGIERDSAATVTRAWRLLGFDLQPPGAMGRPPGS
jgi:P27 family predicted phage terminase small subunit